AGPGTVGRAVGPVVTRDLEPLEDRVVRGLEQDHPVGVGAGAVDRHRSRRAERLEMDVAAVAGVGLVAQHEPGIRAGRHRDHAAVPWAFDGVPRTSASAAAIASVIATYTSTVDRSPGRAYATSSRLAAPTPAVRRARKRKTAAVGSGLARSSTATSTGVS